MASLVSNPQDVDAILDGLRMVTARLQQGERPTPSDQKELAEVYRQLMTFLIEKEPVRDFRKEELEQKIQEKFPVHDPLENVFWEKITEEAK